MISILSARQWLKNGLVLIPPVFGMALWSQTLALQLLLGILGFSLLASAVYLNNDLMDLEMDRMHPEKSKRPLAAGRISKRQALFWMLALFVLGASVLAALSFSALLIGTIYCVTNIIYTFFGKHLPLLDLLFIISGYWMRLWLGSVISNEVLSPWVLVVVSELALYLVLVKRLGDVQLFRATGKSLRATVPFYASLPLEKIITALTGLIAVTFTTYVTVVFHLQAEHFSPFVYACIPLVVLGLWQYSRKAMANAQSDPLKILLMDWTVLVLLFSSFAVLTLSLYQV